MQDSLVILKQASQTHPQRLPSKEKRRPRKGAHLETEDDSGNFHQDEISWVGWPGGQNGKLQWQRHSQWWGPHSHHNLDIVQGVYYKHLGPQYAASIP